MAANENDVTSAIDEVCVSDYIARCLVDCGVTHVFGGHGGAVVPLIDGICRNPKLTWVLTRVEVSASMAAAAYAKVSGTLGCCVGTSGPGASHLTTGLIDAELDHVPVLCFTGLKKREGIGYSDFQDINQTELFSAAGISFSRNVIHRNGLVPLLRDAIATAQTLDVCAHLAIPVDVQQAKIQSPPPLTKVSASGDLTKQCSPAATEIQKVVTFLLEHRANGDMVLLAIGQRAAGEAANNVLQIAEILGAPVVTTLDAKGFVREDHPQVLGVFGIFGHPGMEASAHIVTTATGIVSFGVDDHTQLLPLNENGHQTAQLVQINHSGLHDLKFEATHMLGGDITFITNVILQEIAEKRKDSDDTFCDFDCTATLTTPLAGNIPEEEVMQSPQPSLVSRGITWGSLRTIDKFAAKAIHPRPSIYRTPEDEIVTGFCHPGLVMQRLSNLLQEGAIVCIDNGECALWASLCLCLKRKYQRAISSMKLGTKGYSVYGAMGAAAYKPNAQIVGISDDRCFQFALNELGTLRQMRATVVFIIFSRGGLASYRRECTNGELLPGGHIHSPDFCKVAKAYGGQGIRLCKANASAIDEGLRLAFSNTGLTIVEVVRDPNLRFRMRPRRDSDLTIKEAWTTAKSQSQPVD